MHKYKPVLIFGLLILILVLIKVYFFSAQTSQTGNGKPGAPAPAAVKVEVVVAAELSNDLFVSGTLLGNESIDLQPESAGKITGIFFTEGELVGKGKLLFKLNDAELQASLKKTEAQIALAAEKTQRLKKLLGINGVSTEEYENALNQLQSLQADAEMTRAKLDETEIRAPFNGIIGLKSVSVGSYVSAGTKLVSLEQTDPMKLDISVPEKYAGIIKTGDRINFTVENVPGNFEAVIYATDPRIEPSSRSLKLRARCSNPGGILRSGSFARVLVKLASKPRAIAIPTESLVPDQNGPKVFVVSNGKAVPKPVKTGLRNADRIEITDGLSAGDSLIVTGVLQVKPGVPVKLIQP